MINSPIILSQWCLKNNSILNQSWLAYLLIKNFSLLNWDIYLYIYICTYICFIHKMYALYHYISFTPEKSSLIISDSFCCRTNCSVYWLKVTAIFTEVTILFHAPVASWQVSWWPGDLGWSLACIFRLAAASLGVSFSFGWPCIPQQADRLTLMLVSGLQMHQERTVSDIQVSSCVMYAKVQLAKARQPCAKLIVSVEGNYEGMITSWELLQPFSVNNLPYPVSANACLCSNIIFYPFNVTISTSRLFWFTSLYMSLPISLSPIYKNKF